MAGFLKIVNSFSCNSKKGFDFLQLDFGGSPTNWEFCIPFGFAYRNTNTCGVGDGVPGLQP